MISQPWSLLSRLTFPALTNWGEPLLLGPGSIHVAHTPHERIAKKELLEAVDLYIKVAGRLLQ